MSWAPFPLLRVAIFFMAGILLAIHSEFFLSQFECIIVMISCAVAFATLSGLSNTLGIHKQVLGVVGMVTFLLLGILYVSLKKENLNPDHFIHDSNFNSYDVIIDSYTESRESTWKVVGEVTSTHSETYNSNTRGTVILYFPKSSFEKPFAYGDVLHVFGRPRLVNPPSNPGEFDYQKFLSYRNIYHQHYIRSADSVVFITNDPGSVILSISIAIRNWAQQTMSHFIAGEDELAIASALVLGVKDGLDTDLMRSYATSGAMHVLAVSGLHVGIIYLLLMTLVNPLNKWKKGKWVVAIVVITVLWLYALVTGMSPSVIRSVTMFTFVALSKPLNRSTNIFNLLAVAAFVMLCYDPFLVMSVGFQLSFLAVAGIVYFHPRIYNVWSPRSELVDRVWQLTSVSLAAQLATFPLGLFYFHQFPVYFMLSNLFVIPAAFLVLVGGLGLLAVSVIPVLAKIVGMMVGGTIFMLNFLVAMVENLPASLIRDVEINSWQTILLYILIFSSTGLLVNRKFSWVVTTCIVGATFSFLQWHTCLERYDQNVITIYNVPNHTAIDLAAEGTCHFLADSVLLNEKDAIQFHIAPNRVNQYIRSVIRIQSVNDSFHGVTLVTWNGQRILWINSPVQSLTADINVDFIVISNNALKNYLLPEGIKAHTIILDSSNSYYFAEGMLSRAVHKDINVYSVRHQGAFQVKL